MVGGRLDRARLSGPSITGRMAPRTANGALTATLPRDLIIVLPAPISFFAGVAHVYGSDEQPTAFWARHKHRARRLCLVRLGCATPWPCVSRQGRTSHFARAE